MKKRVEDLRAGDLVSALNNSPQAELWFGSDGVLVPTKSFVNSTNVKQEFGGMVTY